LLWLTAEESGQAEGEEKDREETLAFRQLQRGGLVIALATTRFRQLDGVAYDSHNERNDSPRPTHSVVLAQHDRQPRKRHNQA
jgi:hypothetical protein